MVFVATNKQKEEEKGKKIIVSILFVSNRREAQTGYKPGYGKRNLAGEFYK